MRPPSTAVTYVQTLPPFGKGVPSADGGGLFPVLRKGTKTLTSTNVRQRNERGQSCEKIKVVCANSASTVNSTLSKLRFICPN
jgi:hypothetical protein